MMASGRLIVLSAFCLLEALLTVAVDLSFRPGPTAVVGETGNSAGKDGSIDSSTEEQRIEYPPVGVMVGFVNECIFESAGSRP